MTGSRSGQQVFHRRVNFFFVEISDFLEHGVHRTRLFADGIICVTMPETLRNLQGLVSDLPSSSDFLTFCKALSTTALPAVLAVMSRPQNGQRRWRSTCKRSRKPRHGNLSHQDAQDRKLQDDSIEHQSAPAECHTRPPPSDQRGRREGHEDEQTKILR